MLTSNLLETILGRLPQLSIAVVGDLFLDKYLDLDAALTEVSVETGLDAYQVMRTRCYPGAGGTVLNNLHALGVGRLRTVSVIGDDGEGYELLAGLRSRQVQVDDVISSPWRMTPTYTKPMLQTAGSEARELNRLDVKNRSPHSAEIDRQLIDRLNRTIEECDALIVADQVTERNHGVVTDTVRAHLSVLARRFPNRLIFADSRSHLGLFQNCTTKPNRSELFRSLGRPEPVSVDREALVNAARELCQKNAGPVYTTQGPEGILYVDEHNTHHIPGIRVTGPIDIVGAGDSTTAGIVCALATGAPPAAAAELGCLVASITIQQIGVTGTASPEQVRARWREANS